MQRAPRLCSCGIKVAPGEQCPCERRRAAARKDGRPSASARGYDRAWLRLARAFLATHPRCALCVEAGVFTAAEVVDHIVPVCDRPDLRLDPANLQALCRSHNARKATAEKRARSEGRGGLEAFTKGSKTTAFPLARNNPEFFSSTDEFREADEWF